MGERPCKKEWEASVKKTRVCLHEGEGGEKFLQEISQRLGKELMKSGWTDGISVADELKTQRHHRSHPPALLPYILFALRAAYGRP